MISIHQYTSVKSTPRSRPECSLPLLYSAREETKQAAEITESIEMTALRYNVEDTSTPMIPSITANLPFTQFLHLACHGLQDITDVLKSGLPPLQGTNHIRSHGSQPRLISAFMTFLSARKTAKGDADQPNERIHLAAALLFAGFRNIVATMW